MTARGQADRPRAGGRDAALDPAQDRQAAGEAVLAGLLDREVEEAVTVVIEEAERRAEAIARLMCARNAARTLIDRAVARRRPSAAGAGG